jgi:flavin-binding protein dodecin
MSVYNIVELIGTSPNSWEEAAKHTLATASKSLRDIRLAEVRELDVTLDDSGKVALFRTKLSVSFKYEGS